MAVFTRHTVLRDPETGQTVAVGPGDEVPDEVALAQVTNMDLFLLDDED